MTAAEDLLLALQRATAVRGFQCVLSQRAGALYLAPSGPMPNATETVRFFLSLDPDVAWIEVWTGDTPAAGYRRNRFGKWTVEVPESHLDEAAA